MHERRLRLNNKALHRLVDFSARWVAAGANERRENWLLTKHSSDH